MPALVVNEIFRSIQGESSYAGLPCVFVRLTGCNLRCRYCDTAYAYAEGRRMELDGIVAQVESFRCRLVELTGGEPLLQDDAPALARALLDRGHTVLVETNGSLSVEVLPEGVVRIMDVKCPSSGESGRVRWENLDRLTPRDEVKFVIGTREDYEWARSVVRERRLADRAAVLFSPVFGEMAPATLAEWILQDGLEVRFQIQLHKYVWEPRARGV